MERFCSFLFEEPKRLKNESTGNQCPICPSVFGRRADAFIHFLHAHSIKVESETLNFNSKSDFLEWKLKIEREFEVEFIRDRPEYTTKGVFKIDN